jgi:superfamily II DNA or RNA helicase
MKLFDYQQNLVDKISQSIRNGSKMPLAVLPTGGGKTVVFSYLCHRYVQVKKRALILTHRQELLKQASNTLSKFGIEYGVIKAGYTPNPFALVQVASVATLVRRLNKVDFKPDIIIIDECHHATANTYKKIIEHYNTRHVLGFTATPIRSDGTGLGDVFDSINIGASVTTLIHLGRLSKPKYFSPVDVDLSSVKMRGKDYDESGLNDVMDKPTITGDAIDNYRKYGEGMPAVAFCVSVKHAEHVAQQFRQAGISAMAVSGQTPDADRQRILAGLGTGEVQVVCSCDLISEGFDIPAIGVAILLRPTMSLGLYMQQVGRALRVTEGKTHAVILDHANNYKRHGLVTQPFDWSLKGMEKKKKKQQAEEVQLKTRQCDYCFIVFEPREAIKGCCPDCGTVLKKQPRVIRTKAGELVEVQDDFISVDLIADMPIGYMGGAAAWIDAKIQEEKQKRAFKTETWKCKTLADWQRLAKSKGYSMGWAYHRFNARNKKLTK